MPPHPLNNFEIQKYYQKEPRLNGVYSRDNLPECISVKIKDEAYIINLGTHWIALYILNNDVTYFDSFGVDYIPKEIKTFVANKNIKTNIFSTQAYDTITCGYFCIGFDFMLAGKT